MAAMRPCSSVSFADTSTIGSSVSFADKSTIDSGVSFADKSTIDSSVSGADKSTIDSSVSSVTDSDTDAVATLAQVSLGPTWLTASRARASWPPQAELLAAVVATVCALHWLVVMVVLLSPLMVVLLSPLCWNSWTQPSSSDTCLRTRGAPARRRSGSRCASAKHGKQARSHGSRRRSWATCSLPREPWSRQAQDSIDLILTLIRTLPLTPTPPFLLLLLLSFCCSFCISSTSMSFLAQHY